MVELVEHADRRLSRGWGGDTLNTAVYLARLGVPVDYVTALGDDSWSAEMIAGWQAEGVGTRHVLQLPGRTPGLYLIQTDGKGERRFSYWRDSAPARDLFRLPQSTAIGESLSGFDLIYFSGISLSLYGQDGRAVFMETLDRARAAGARLAFDTNFRPRGWPDRTAARQAYREAMQRADIALCSSEDLQMLFGTPAAEALADLPAPGEIVLKEETPGCVVMSGGRSEHVATEHCIPVDTTAAGDSFAAAYLWARLAGAAPVTAARAGHRLAGAVIRHPGAIIPRPAMPSIELASL